LPVRSPLLGQSLLFSLPEITKMFQFTSLPSLTYGFSQGYPLKDRLSHSETPGSRCVCHSPRLIAAYHVLHRQPMPRHSPYTFIHFIQLITSRRNYVLHFQDTMSKNTIHICCRDAQFARLYNKIFSGANRSRTCDFLLAKQALSQLSYSPGLAITSP
jgi:hypothetical protein